MEVLPLWVRDFIELQAGPALVLGFQGENVYIFFPSILAWVFKKMHEGKKYSEV